VALNSNRKTREVAAMKACYRLTFMYC